MVLSKEGYKIKEKLYQSARTAVYSALQEKEQKKVIIKVLDKEYPSAKEIARFHYEFELIKKFDSPHIIKVTDIKKWKNSYALILEDTGARTLLESFPEKLSIEIFLEIALKLVKAIQTIHTQNIIHKDINPKNILWCAKTREIKIIDFGVSTELNREQQDINTSQKLEGMLAYISPEQTGRMNRYVDYRTDYYSLGITLYELITKNLPFSAKEALDWIHQHIAQNPKNPSEIDQRIPEMISQIILKLMSKDAEDRYQSSRGILADLVNCQKQFQENKKITQFQLAKEDVPEKFQISQKLIGREEELKGLKKLIEKTANGSTELALISGYSGIGKTALVQELYKTIIHKKGYYLKGKFEQYSGNLPYAAVVQALRDLTKQLLSQTEEQLQNWQEKLKEVLGPNGQIMVSLIPELELIIGKQPETAKLNPQEEHNRFLITFKNFIKIFAQKEHPLVIFLDDLHWCDLPTMKLLESLITSSEIASLLIIGAYRNNEVNSTHPLILGFEEILKKRTIHKFEIHPLKASDIDQIVANSLCQSVEKVKILSEIIFQKTQGNPFFIEEILKKFYFEKFFNLNAITGKWEWDIKNIKEAQVSNNIVEFIVHRFKTLPKETQKALVLGSCLGGSFELNLLAKINEATPEETAEALGPAFQQGLTFSQIEYYFEVENNSSRAGKPKEKIIYKFCHDRIQQAAYSMLEEEEKIKIHSQIGQLLFTDYQKTKNEDELINIVEHLNKGKSLITEKKQKQELIKLNVEAGKKAKSAIAYQAGYKYLSVAKEILGQESWQKEYALCFEVNKEFAECAYLCGEFDVAEATIQFLLEKTKTKLEKAEIMYMKVVQYTVMGKMDEAIKSALEGLRLYKIKIPKKPSLISILLNFHKTKWLFRKYSKIDLLNLPLITDPEKKMCIKLLMEITPAAYLSGQEALYVLAILKMNEYALRFGNSPESAFCFTGYGMLLTSAFQDFNNGYQFSKLGVRLINKINDYQLRGRILFVHVMFNEAWNEHAHTLISSYQNVIDSCLESGDLFFLGHACMHLVKVYLEQDINRALIENKKYLLIAEKTNYLASYLSSILLTQFCLSMISLDESKFIFNTSELNESELLITLNDGEYFGGLCEFHLYKLQINYLFNRYNNAEESINNLKNKKLITATAGQILIFDISLFTFLTQVNLIKNKNIIEKVRLWQSIIKEFNKMKKWAAHCPVNFLHHKLLMQAEIARIKNQPQKAQKFYDQAITAAKENDYIRYEALCNELAAKFHLAQGNLKMASVYMQDAHYCYERWGAIAKVKHLEETYPQLLKKIPANDPNASPTIHKSDSREDKFKNLDYQMLTKVSQTISSEIQTPKIIQELLTSITKIAGAEKCVLLLKNEKETEFQISSLEHEQIAHYQEVKLEDYGLVSQAIINYVLHSKEILVLADAGSDANYNQDPHIQTEKVKSVLCLPILRQNILKGVIYLENNLTTHAFTEEYISALKVLAAQAAISLENASLYENLEEKVKVRTKELQETNSKLNQVNKEVESQKQELEKLNSTMSHELKNTCFGIKQIVDMVLTSEPDLKEKSASMLGSIVEQSSKLFDFSRNYLYPVRNKNDKIRQVSINEVLYQ